MQYSREKMKPILEEAIRLPVRRLFFGAPAPEPPRPTLIHRPSRIILPLSGSKHLEFADGKSLRNEILQPGDALITHPGGWSIEPWNREHRMISIVFHPEHIRTLFIAHPGTGPAQEGPDLFFHTPFPLNAAGKHTLAAILEQNADTRSARHNLQALLALVADTIAACDSEQTQEEAAWGRIVEAMERNLSGTIGRDDLAALVRIHPAQLSRLILKHTHQSWSEYRNRLRLLHAEELLKHGSLPVAEIAELCGFSYSNYFIRIFRQHYGVAPAQYRKKFH